MDNVVYAKIVTCVYLAWNNLDLQQKLNYFDYNSLDEWAEDDDQEDEYDVYDFDVWAKERIGYIDCAEKLEQYGLKVLSARESATYRNGIGYQVDTYKVSGSQQNIDKAKNELFWITDCNVVDPLQTWIDSNDNDDDDDYYDDDDD